MDLLQDSIDTPDARVHLTKSEIEDQCSIISELAQTPEKARASLSQAKALIRSAPFEEQPQLLAAQLLEKSQNKKDMLDTWKSLHERFPANQLALRFYVRWLSRENRDEDAASLLFQIIDGDDGSLDLLAFSELCAEIRDVKIASGFFDQILALEPDNVRIRVVFGKYLFNHSKIYEAFSILDPIRGESLSQTAQSVLEKSDRAVFAMETISPTGIENADQQHSVLSNALKLFRNRKTRALNPSEINGISFYTGSLGAGGAERQLTQMASAFHHRLKAGRNINGITLKGKIEVIVNNVDKSRGKDFFLPALKANGIDMHVTANMPTQDLSEIDYNRPALRDIAPLLSRNVRYGLERLVAHFKASQPDVAYFWQDGAVLTGTLAALIAEVPRIAISLRGLPPNLRPHMMKPEYPDLYRELAKIPGISFSCNSRTAADAYADWLGLDKSKFSVIYNAMRALPEDAEENELRRWQVFEKETADSSFTLGGVFRFTSNKRPLMWLDFAARAYQSNPNLRFIIVGNGDELSLAQSRAAELGIEDRTLFTGSTSHPGFWLSKMDATMLLSENEGLPNVLMEAQIAGKPVISTPAGGTPETFIDGHSGYLLSSATSPSYEEFAIYLNRLVNDVPLRRSLGDNARISASAKFDREHVFSQTIRHFMGETIAGDTETLARDNFSDITKSFRPAIAGKSVVETYSVLASN